MPRCRFLTSCAVLDPPSSFVSSLPLFLGLAQSRGGAEMLDGRVSSQSLVMAQAARAVAELCEHSHECRRKVSERYVAMDILRDVKRGTSVGSLEAAEQVGPRAPAP